VSLNYKKIKLKKDIIEFIDMNMPKIRSHGGEFDIYELNMNSGFLKIKFAGSCSSCKHGLYKTEELKRRIPENFCEIENVLIEFV